MGGGWTRGQGERQIQKKRIFNLSLDLKVGVKTNEEEYIAFCEKWKTTHVKRGGGEMGREKGLTGKVGRIFCRFRIRDHCKEETC